MMMREKPVELPETVRVKLSSEAAGGITITPVVVRDMPVRELVDQMLEVTGKDPTRVREVLRRGNLVRGASRMRWAGWDAAAAGIEALLATFPEAEPQRPFHRDRCVRAVLRGAAGTISLPRAVAAKRRFLRRRGFWESLMEAVTPAEAHYLEYSYQDRADRYRMALEAAAAARLREQADLLVYSSLAGQVRGVLAEPIDLYTER